VAARDGKDRRVMLNPYDSPAFDNRGLSGTYCGLIVLPGMERFLKALSEV
jgi:hypothetical protein